MGVLWFKSEPLYTFTSQDEVWLCRALYGEEGADGGGAGGRAVAATMLNRFAMLGVRGWIRRVLNMESKAVAKGWTSFWSFLRDYSQPINPRWLHGGSKDPDPTSISDQERRRAKITGMPYLEIPKAIRALGSSLLCARPEVESAGCIPLWEAGVPADLTGLVHFYSPIYYLAKNRKVKRSALSDFEVREACRKGYASSSVGLVWQQPEGVDPRGNAFYRVRATRDWRPEWVRVERSRG